MNPLKLEYQFAKGETGQDILALFSSALSAAERLEERWTDDTMGNGEELLGQIDRDLLRLDELCQDDEAIRDALSEKSFYREQMENVRFTLEKIRSAEEKKDGQNVLALVKYQLSCFLRELLEEIYFWAYVHPRRERWDAYYESEFAAHHRNEFFSPEGAPCEVSIFVPAKDKLEYTKRCVESILRETDGTKVSYELILINHGSRDDTQEYFERLELPSSRPEFTPHIKLLHFKENVRMIMFSSALRVCEGKYVAFVSNDTVVTKGWLELLLQCIRSDRDIVSATPTTPNISNFQSIPESYKDLEEMARFAADFNRHDPVKWERRARMMPVIALYDMEKVNQIGFADRYFRTMEFWDDDFSLRARRAGYRQLLCRDVFCHHYGSVTGGEAQVKENTLQIGRKLFVEKHRVDPWENGAYYDYHVCSQLKNRKMPLGLQTDILGVDCGFGDTPLQISNLLRGIGITSSIDNVTVQLQYAEDLKGMSRTLLAAEDERGLLDCLSKDLADRQYGYIYLSRPLENYSNWKELLNRLCDRLETGGTLIFSVTNALDLGNFQWFSALAFPAGKERLNYLNQDMVEAHLRTRLPGVLKQQKRGWASGELLASLVKQVRVRWLPEESLLSLMDTVSFQFFATKES